MTRSKSIVMLIWALFAAICLFLLGCDKEKESSYPYDLVFMTEEYKPLNYTEDNKLTGLAPELLEEICRQLKIPFDVDVLPWQEAYMALQDTDNAVLFTMSLNEERGDQYKWAGPYASLEWTFYAAAPNGLTLKSLDDAKKVRAVGVISDYTMDQYLVNHGFTNLVYCQNNTDAFQKLLNGDIDLFATDRITAEAALKTLGKSYFNVKELLPIQTELLYFSFNKQVPDEVVADFQTEIDRLKKSGFLRSLSEKYLNTSHFPGTLLVYTEDYPPLTFINSFGQVSGYGSDIVFEIMKRNKLYLDVKLSTWSNGYNLALLNPNVVLYTMDRTDSRENLFQWVGPIGTNTSYFYTRAASGIQINSIEDAKALGAVGTVSTWFSDQKLREMGFTNLVSDNNPAAMTIKLMTGEIDAFVCSGVTFADILNAHGYSIMDVKPAFALMSSDFYVAISKGTPQTVVDQWQKAFDQMKQDGTTEAIRKKWFPGE